MVGGEATASKGVGVSGQAPPRCSLLCHFLPPLQGPPQHRAPTTGLAPTHPPETKYSSSATAVALVSGAACAAVTLANVAWSGEQVSRQKRCLKLWLQAGQPTRKMDAIWICRATNRGVGWQKGGPVG